MDTHFNKLTPGEAERLAFVAEEMGEAIQLIGKVLRHGYESVNPNDPRQTPNRQLLTEELGDVTTCIALMVEAMDIEFEDIEAHAEVKLRRLSKYQHHQGDLLNECLKLNSAA
jgi:NTP pyrophosphatase (non-canonical NTP hydrolase)